MDYIGLLKNIITPLLVNDTNIEVTEVPNDEENFMEFLVKVSESEISRIIGREGKTANAIRQIIKIAAVKEEKRVRVTFETL